MAQGGVIPAKRERESLHSGMGNLIPRERKSLHRGRGNPSTRGGVIPAQREGKIPLLKEGNPCTQGGRNPAPRKYEILGGRMFIDDDLEQR